MRKIWASSASIIMGVLASVAANCPSAHAVTCSISPEVAVAEGQTQTVTAGSPCVGIWNGTIGGTRALPTKSTVSGEIDGGITGEIGIIENGVGNTETDMGLTQTDTITAHIPNFFEFLLGSTDVQFGHINYDLSSVGLFIAGKATATITNREEATGAYLDYHASASLLGTSESATKEIGPCGGETLICPGVNKSWSLLLSVADVEVPIADFSLTLSERVILNTIAGVATSNVQIDAFDPFDVTAIDLLDAKGQIIPGVSFTDSSGFVFPTDSGPLSAGAVPETSTWAMMLIGFVGLSFAGWRAQRRSAVV